MNKVAIKYINSTHKNIQGWLEELAMRVVLSVADAQQQEGVNGGVAEIGVFHGKLIIFLSLLCSKEYRCAAYDLFERQDENIDKSGKMADREVFEKNINKYSHNKDLFIIKEENSFNLTSELVKLDCQGEVKLFSVDGGHTAEITYNDLNVAIGSLCQGGIIILDDYFNEAWPAVSEGTTQFVMDFRRRRGREVHPVAVAGNKLLFTNSAQHAQKYIENLSHLSDKYVDKRSTMYGDEVIVLSTPRSKIKQRLRNTMVWSLVRRSNLGKAVQKMFTHL